MIAKGHLTAVHRALVSWRIRTLGRTGGGVTTLQIQCVRACSPPFVVVRALIWGSFGDAVSFRLD